MYDILELNKKLLSDLKDIAKELKIKRVESYKKQDLIYKILDQQAIVASEAKASKKTKPEQERPKRDKPFQKPQRAQKPQDTKKPSKENPKKEDQPKVPKSKDESKETKPQNEVKSDSKKPDSIKSDSSKPKEVKKESERDLKKSILRRRSRSIRGIEIRGMKVLISVSLTTKMIKMALDVHRRTEGKTINMTLKV